MHTDMSGPESRNFSLTKFLVAAGVALLFGGFAACGNSVGSVDYQSYCSQLQDCTGGFVYDSINQCANSTRSLVEQLNGGCQNAYIDFLKCQDANGVCQAGSSCESESNNVSSSCSGNPIR